MNKERKSIDKITLKHIKKRTIRVMFDMYPFELEGGKTRTFPRYIASMFIRKYPRRLKVV